MFKALDLWLPGYLRRRAHPGGATDILVAVCDHFEPLHRTNTAGALERVRLWQKEYPKLIAQFRDADGVRPRHTFFYPVEQYNPDILHEIGRLCDLSGGEVEVHLHHDQDTAENLTKQLEQGKTQLTAHGMLSRDDEGHVRYGFVHGNWALDDSDPTRRNCGVSEELGVLRRTGCFADFTMPSAPHRTQTRIVNSVYYALDTPARKSHDSGRLARVGNPMPPGAAGKDGSELLLIQGPLGLNWRQRKFGLLPRVENSDLTGRNPPTANRLRLWKKLGIHVQNRPEWIFVKLHTHGAHPANSPMLLGEPMRQFFQTLTSGENGLNGLRTHFVTAREMTNIVHAAEDGCTGNPGQFRDYRFRRASLVSG